VLEQTPSQTIGPYFIFGLTPASDVNSIVHRVELVNAQTQGQRIVITGRVFDGIGDPLDDAMIEIWQAEANGRYHHSADTREAPERDPDFFGFGRCGTDNDGAYKFSTIKPGRVPGCNQDMQAPHVNLVLFSRGLLVHVYTRIYFADEQQLNTTDSILNSVAPARRTTLISKMEEQAQPSVHRFDIHLQGEQETVFFDV